MFVFLMILLAVLPLLLQWLLPLIKDGKTMTPDQAVFLKQQMAICAGALEMLNSEKLTKRQQAKLKKYRDAYLQIKMNAPKAGCAIE